MARQRGSNFSTFEKMLLSELMEDFGIIIEDKKTDSVTLEKKEETWVMLAERFNGSTGIKAASHFYPLPLPLGKGVPILIWVKG